MRSAKSLRILQSIPFLMLCATLTAYGGDGSVLQATSNNSDNSVPCLPFSAKQFLKSLFQNTNASPEDAYVFPAELGFVSPFDLPNFHQVEPYLYRGGAPTENGLKVLQKMGIKTVVDLRKSLDQVQKESHEVRALGMQYVCLPVSRGIPEITYQEKFFHMVKSATKKPDQGPIFVHCDYGCDRTGYMVGMWRVQHDHWNSYDALQEMLKYGYLIHLAGPEESRVRSWLNKLESPAGQ
jgi:protein tyrosine phosphatase (PTP) superfamily phosphohydrolase (DUF442 family)